jgi:SAM-dependent methyltransferase
VPHPRPELALAEAARVLVPGGWLAVFDGDYVTITVATGPADPLQAGAQGFVDSSVHDPWLVRRLPDLLERAGFALGSVRGFSYLETREARYTPTIVERGADALVAAGRIGPDSAAALKAETHRRVAASQFFGHIAYASLVARKRR